MVSHFFRRRDQGRLANAWWKDMDIYYGPIDPTRQQEVNTAFVPSDADADEPGREAE